MTIQLEAYDAIMGGTTRLRPHFILRLSLGMTSHDALNTLATAVENWPQRFDFLVSRLCVLPALQSSVRWAHFVALVNSPATPTPSEGFAEMPPSPANSTFEYSTGTTHPRAPGTTVGDAIGSHGAQAKPDESGTAHAQPLSLQPSKEAPGPFRYLSPLPARPEWTAGCVYHERRYPKCGK